MESPEKKEMEGEAAPVDPCCWVHKRKELFLQPHYLNSVMKGVGDAMDATVKKFQADLGGIVLRHKNSKLISVDGSITDEESHIRLLVEADFEIFRPYVGCQMRGVVNKVSDNHVSCLVYEVFNISCPRDLNNPENWIGDQAYLGQELTLGVTKVDLLSRLPYIRADILELHHAETEANHVKFEDEDEVEIKEEPEEVKEESEEDSEPEVPVKKKKKKEEQLSQTEDLNTSVSKKKKKKSLEVEEDVKPDIEELLKKLSKKKRRELEELVEKMSEIPEKKKKKKSKSRDEEAPDVYIKQEVVSAGPSDAELSPEKNSKSSKRKRKSETVDESPKKKKKRRRTLVNSDGEEFYYDSDGCPVAVG